MPTTQPVASLLLTPEVTAKLFASLNSDNERVCFIFGKVRGERAIGTEAVVPAESDYLESSPVHVAVSPRFVVKEFLPRLSRGVLPVVVVHSQPMKWPSGGDLTTHEKAVSFYPYQLLGTYDGTELSFFRLNDGRPELVEHSVMDYALYDRQIRLWGKDAQLIISTTTVALVGCGGGNTHVAYQLAGMGFNLILIDPDKWEESNRNRVLVPRDHVGLFKAESVSKIIRVTYPTVNVQASPTRLEDAPASLLVQADVLVIGPDSITARIAGNLVSVSMHKPAVFPAAGIEASNGELARIGGTVQVFIPGLTPCYQCHLRVDQEKLRLETSDDAQRATIREKYGIDVPIVPALPALNSVLAGVAVWEVVKIVTRIDTPKPLVYYDALGQTMSSYSILPNENCVICSHLQQNSRGKPMFESQAPNRETQIAGARRFTKWLMGKMGLCYGQIISRNH